MRINEVNKKLVEFDDDNLSYFDIKVDTHQDIENDEFGRMTGKKKRHTTRKPVITLRHINKLKKAKKVRMQAEDKRRRLMGIMYGQKPSEEP